MEIENSRCQLEVTISTGTIKLSGTEEFIKLYKNELLEFLKENYISRKEDATKVINGTKDISSEIKTENTNINKDICSNKPTELDKYSSLIQIDSDGNIKLLKEPQGKNVSEKAREIAKIVLYIKTLIENKQIRILGSELIPLCKRHGCYDSANYSKAFDNQKDFIKGGKEKSPNWTLELNFAGEQNAKKLLEDMLNADN